jgi:hypothetical protein
MCDCWLIDRAATPIASIGGAASSTGTTSSVSIPTTQGHRGWSRTKGGSTTWATANTRRQTEAYRTSRSPTSIRGRRGNPVRCRSSGRSSSHRSPSGPRACPTALSQ